jgi:hypothetical protein
MNKSRHETRERLEQLSGDIDAERSPQLLRGTIRNLRKTRTTHDFMFTQADRNRMGAASVAAAMEGLGGLAIGLAGSAMDTADEADLLEFELDGKPIRAWVWWSVFQDGDDVEIVAEPSEKGWQAYGIRRLTDKILTLHPHCSRGRYAHYKKTLLFLVATFAPIYLFGLGVSAVFILHDGGGWDGFLSGVLGGGR